MPFHVPKCVSLLRWLSIASGMQTVFVRVPLCVHSLPTPGAPQTWGVKRSLRMGFNDTGSSGRPHFKAEAGRISSRTCVHSTRLCSRMHACDVPSSWINPPQIQRSFQSSLPRSCRHEESRRTMHVFWWFRILQSKCQAPQTDTWAWVGVVPGGRWERRYNSNQTTLTTVQGPTAASKDVFENKVWMD